MLSPFFATSWHRYAAPASQLLQFFIWERRCKCKTQITVLEQFDTIQVNKECGEICVVYATGVQPPRTLCFDDDALDVTIQNVAHLLWRKSPLECIERLFAILSCQPLRH